MTAKELFDKAATALSSAQLLFKSGDFDGTCNRAYYAMFDAPRAALLVADGNESALAIKTHGGLISAFSLRLVKSGAVMKLEAHEATKPSADIAAETRFMLTPKNSFGTNPIRS